MAAFVADTDPAAYEKLVDRFLASPRYGERWARHWLDVVHYGDTHGYDKDQPRPNAWPYRDYVIRSLNTDKPFARFIEEPVAGDILHAATIDGHEGIGFIAAGPWDLIGQRLERFAQMREDLPDRPRRRAGERAGTSGSRGGGLLAGFSPSEPTLEVLRHDLVEGRLLGPTPLVAAGCRGAAIRPGSARRQTPPRGGVPGLAPALCRDAEPQLP